MCYVDEDLILTQYELIFQREQNKIEKEEKLWNSEEHIYIGFLDKKDVISMFYDAFRSEEINRILKELSDYCIVPEKTRSKLLETDLTDEDLDHLANAREINMVKNVLLKIKFTDDGELIINEDYYGCNYISVLFSYLYEHGYIRNSDFPFDLHYLDFLQEKLFAVENRVKLLREEARGLQKDEREKKKSEQWMTEETQFLIEAVIYRKQKEMIKSLSRKMRLNKNYQRVYTL